MIRSLYALGRHVREALGDDPAAIVEQLALTGAEDEAESGNSAGVPWRFRHMSDQGTLAASCRGSECGYAPTVSLASAHEVLAWR